MSLILGARPIAPFVYRNENGQGTLAVMGNDCSLTSTTCQVDSFKSGVPLAGVVADQTIGIGVSPAVGLANTFVGSRAGETVVDPLLSQNCTCVGKAAWCGNAVDGPTAIGANTNAAFAGSIAIGSSTQAQGAHNVAVGSSVNNVTDYSVALGSDGNTHVRFDVPDAVSQITSNVTPVTVTKLQGKITMFAGVDTTTVTFTVNCADVTTNSLVFLNLDGVDAGGRPLIGYAHNILAGSFDITLRLMAGGVGLTTYNPIISYMIYYPA